MDILYNFIRYDSPKFGIFSITTSEYQNGWVSKEVEYKIIGEDDNSYVTHLLQSGHGEWVGDIVIRKEYILPIGIHKSRLVKWVPGQLSIFD